MVTLNIPGRAYEYEYKGLSTDEKPADCAENSLFLELDTGKFYYFDGEAWNELGTGGGGGGGDVLYEGTLTFSVSGSEPYLYYKNDEPFTMSSVPEPGGDVYLYMDNNLAGNSTWGFSEGAYTAYIGDDYMIEYSTDGDGYIYVENTTTTGDHTIEIRKTAKPND